MSFSRSVLSAILGVCHTSVRMLDLVVLSLGRDLRRVALVTVLPNNVVVVAADGDLFDSGHGDVVVVAGDLKFIHGRTIDVVIIPGNHDLPALSFDRELVVVAANGDRTVAVER